jgi:hypothetical protein
MGNFLSRKKRKSRSHSRRRQAALGISQEWIDSIHSGVLLGGWCTYSCIVEGRTVNGLIKSVGELAELVERFKDEEVFRFNILWMVVPGTAVGSSTGERVY